LVHLLMRRTTMSHSRKQKFKQKKISQVADFFLSTIMSCFI
jgi:hypothetical protein